MSRLKKSINLNLNKLTEAFPYQKEAIDAVRDMEYSAIFFEQGLGKNQNRNRPYARLADRGYC